MNWLSRKLYLYSITVGVYGLEWWERCSFNALLLLLLWVVLSAALRASLQIYNGSTVKEENKR
ncbi:unnamed protein product [Spirodela intermedia]|uniref:Uncharacterized protein n=2 Tax=Spirodela intermedia TaxID=51605 RepID=A0A7I8J7H9_SPIIN|nr:unnamed protein product [Spirodela intermedia]CAA6666000.1 unnamed protein product [Spirodela intermedia]CAA7402758.1 unnamed protein product [Spirodela intermedia]